MLVCASLRNFAREIAGAARTRHSLYPLYVEGDKRKNSGALRREDVELWLDGVDDAHDREAKNLTAIPAAPPRSHLRAQSRRHGSPRHRCRSRHGPNAAAAPAGW